MAVQVDQGRVAGSQAVAGDAALYGIACAPGACLAAGNTETGGFVTLLSVQGTPTHRPPAPPACRPTGAALSPPGLVARLSGVDRDATAVRVSQEDFPGPASAQAVVLASNAAFPDALAGTPLAVAVGGPLLLSPPADLDPVVAAEISRVLPAGATVYLLGRGRRPELGGGGRGRPPSVMSPSASPAPTASPPRWRWPSSSATRPRCSRPPGSTSPTPCRPGPRPPGPAAPSC